MSSCWPKASTASSASAPACAQQPKPRHVALAVKEMHFLPQRDDRERASTCKGDEGVVIEAMGTITRGMTGTGFIYTNRECISIGIGCLVSDFREDRRDALRPAGSVQEASLASSRCWPDPR